MAAKAKSEKAESQRIERALQDIETIHDFIADTNFYRRKSERHKSNFKIAVSIVTKGKKEFDTGTAICSNISLDGMLIGKLKLNNGCIPINSFTMKVELVDGPLKGMKLDTSLVYFSNKKNKGHLAVVFDKISKANQKKITKLMESDQ